MALFYIKDNGVYLYNETEKKYFPVDIKAVEETVTTKTIIGTEITPKTSGVENLAYTKVMTDEEVIRAFGITGLSAYKPPVYLNVVNDFTMGDITAAVVDIGLVPSTATVVVASSKTATATVAYSAGKVTVTPIAVGDTVITVTASATNYQDTVITFKVVVIDEVAITAISDVTFDTATESVSVVVDPLDAAITATSSDNTIVTVAVEDDGSLTLTAVEGGTATITVTASKADYFNGVETFGVTIPAIIGITPIEDITLVESGTAQEITVVTDTESATISVTSDDELVATVAVLANKITVTPVGEGEATITVTATKAGCLDGVTTFGVVVTASGG